MLRHLVLAVCVLLASTAAIAQTTTATSATVTGIVADEQAGVLPGVTVTLTGSNMMGMQTQVTDASGLYRFVALPPGEYRLSFELTGFATITREAIRVTAGFTASINVRMSVAGIEEALVVTGESPVVDTQSTSIVTTFDKDTLANLPSARDYWAILSEAPGVKLTRIDVGGSAAGTQTGYFVYGTTGQNRPMVEGINSTEGTGAFGNYVDYGSFQEVSIGSGAASAESPVPGVYTVLISKSGGNRYTGSFYGDYESKDWQSYNIDAEQIAAGVTGGGGLQPEDVNRLDSYRDLNADIGGYLKKDAIWWYASVRSLDSAVRYTNFPVKPHETHLGNFTAKLTYQLSQNNKLIGYYQPSTKVQKNRLDRQLLGSQAAIHLTDDASFRQDYSPLLWKAEWNSVFSPSTFFEMRTGQFGYEWPDTPNGTGISYEDLNTSIVSGRARARQLNIQRTQVLGSLSHFKSDWGGSHNFKVGWEWFRETSTPMRFAGSYNDILHVLRSGAASEVMLFEPAVSENGLYTIGLFAQDTWQLGNRLSLNLGLRFDHYRNFLPEQEHLAGQFTPTDILFEAVDNVNTWNLFASRIGLSYALTADSKTVLKANYGQYWWNPGAALSQNVNPNPETWNRRYVWSDSNRDLVWQPGEEGRLNSSAGGLASVVLAEDLKDSYTQELAFWLERELFTNFGVRGGAAWRGERQLAMEFNANRPFEAFSVPVTIIDPGPDGVRGNADDGNAIAAFNLAPQYLALPVVNTYANVPGGSDYYTVEVTATKRMSSRWSALMSFSHTWSAAQEKDYFGQVFRQNDLPITPNDLINVEPDGQVKYTDWALKLHGTYEGPWGLKISPMLRHQAGQNFGRTFTAVMNYGTIRVPSETLNTRRQDNVNILDFRAEKVVRLGANFSVAPFMDIYNVLNANPVQNQTWASGSSYLRPTNIVPPRLLRLGAKVNW
jgi:Carboxypeptidase regulatory-like domain/TonB dependent receptor-like, beta-barrel